MPSMQAEAKPRRPMRRSARTCGRRRSKSWSRAQVPSCESSSTNTASQSSPSSAAVNFASSGAMLSRSFSVGTITASSGAGRRANAAPTRAVAGAASANMPSGSAGSG
jgi:hypothetical protein